MVDSNHNMKQSIQQHSLGRIFYILSKVVLLKSYLVQLLKLVFTLMMRHAGRRAFAIFAKGPEFSRNHSPFQCFCSAAVLRKLRVMTRDEQTAISSAELQELVLPGMANHHGTLFAGLGLQLMAKAAFMAARKLARRAP